MEKITSVAIVALAINSRGHIFAGSATSGVFRSTTNGQNWQLVINGMTNLQVRAFAINRNDEVFAGTNGGGIYRSLNNGDTWGETPLGLTNRVIISLATDRQGNIFAGSDGAGVFRSTDNGGNWSQLNAGLLNLRVRALAVNADGYVFAGTSGTGVFRSVQPTTSVGESVVESPADFLLEQNYPNPFNPSTNIPFVLPRPSRVTLKIFDHLGKEVVTLVDEKKSAGRHETHLQAAGWPSGVYFYRLQADGFLVETKKLVLLK
jgi:hypothetical protein